MVIAHLSDLHVSRFGEHVTSLRTRGLHGWRQRRGERWELVEEVQAAWRIERRLRELRLVDDGGIVHARKRIEPTGEVELRRALAELASERLIADQRRLAAELPDLATVEALLREDPTNTNLLFCRAAYCVRQDQPDWVLVSGDVTDDGVGYELVLAALAPFVERGRLLAVPGNHDVYDSPPLVVPRHARTGRRIKRERWAAFAARLGLPPDGAWVRTLDDGAILCGLDSCVPARTPFSASGAVTTESLATIEAALAEVPPEACRLAMLHHHVVNLPLRAGGWAPWQLGMRLRNAKEVYDFLQRHQFRGVLNGHRHVGYRYHPSHAPLFVSAPSTTLGCRSRVVDRPYYWRIEVTDGEIASVRERLL
jgi:3',5'-cyclic AMP phosphodiesterase CpdA